MKDVLSPAVADVISRASLEKKLKAGKKLRVKFGADPSAPNLHLGHLVALDQLRLLSGASVAEHLARLAAKSRGLKVRVLSRAPMPHLFARAYAALFPRENRLRLRALLRQRRRPRP